MEIRYVLLLVIGPIGLKRNEDNNIVFYIEKNIALWGGCVAVVPVTEDRENIYRFANLIISGPIASAIFGISTIIIYAYINGIFYLLLGAMSLGIAFATMIPMRAGCFYTDGGRWIRIRGKGSAAKIELALLGFIQSYYINKNYSQISIEDTKLLSTDSDKRNQYLGYYFAFLYYRDNFETNHMEAERKNLKALESSVPKNYVKLLSLE